MKKVIRSKILVLVLLVALTTSVASCGFLLYPERKGRSSGNIDPVVLIMDCAWLICFFVPGIVALVVDFTTGCIYEGGTAINVEPGDMVKFRMRGPAPADAKVTVEIESADGSRVIATLHEQEFDKGEELKGPETFAIPEMFNPGEYKLSLKVNDVTSVSYKLHVTQ